MRSVAEVLATKLAPSSAELQDLLADLTSAATALSRQGHIIFVLFIRSVFSEAQADQVCWF